MFAPTAAPEQDTIETSGEPMFDLIDDAAGTSPLDCAEDAGPRFRIQPGFAAITALLAVLGLSLHGVAADGGYWTAGPVLFTVIFTVALMVLIAVHEAGHVVAGRMHGHRLVSVRLGSKFGVTMLGDHTPAVTARIAAAGPMIGTLASVAVLVATTGTPLAPLWAAAAVALVENVANVGLFFMAGSDGSKIVGALKHRCDHAPQPQTAPLAPLPAAT